ncbi:hypothetical protein [Sorangium sp. So ce117]|uniref:hypothetical protein n=1 Tax=Sorangium sp. So ce117 TaxID=3133277 RepID=UPI003F5D74E5
MDQLGRGGHRRLSQKHEIARERCCFDRPGDLVSITGIVTPLEEPPRSLAQDFDDIDRAPRVSGYLMQQRPGGLKGAPERGHDEDPAAARDGLLCHRAIDPHHQTVRDGDRLRDAAEGRAGAHDDPRALVRERLNDRGGGRADAVRDRAGRQRIRKEALLHLMPDHNRVVYVPNETAERLDVNAGSMKKYEHVSRCPEAACLVMGR